MSEIVRTTRDPSAHERAGDAPWPLRTSPQGRFVTVRLTQTQVAALRDFANGSKACTEVTAKAILRAVLGE